MEQILVDLKKSIQEIAGDRLIKMVLYGSKASGDYSKDSDTDIAIVVRGLSRESMPWLPTSKNTGPIPKTIAAYPLDP